MCAVEEENRYRMCAQEPCLHFIACSVVRFLFFGYATRKSDPQRDECDVVLSLGPTADTPPARVKLSWPLVTQTKRGDGSYLYLEKRPEGKDSASRLLPYLPTLYLRIHYQRRLHPSS
jgi:hypothetical protein